MRVLIDTCVVMDWLQKRDPFGKNALSIFIAASRQYFDGYITAKSATDIFYLSHRSAHSNSESKAMLKSVLSLVDVLDTTSGDIASALSSPISDFEDAVMEATAARCRVDCIVTRNVQDFLRGEVPVLTPEEFLTRIPLGIS